MYVKFEDLPSNSRVWIYQSDREFSDQEINFITEKAIEFIEQWTKHGFNLKGSFTIKYNQFLVLAVDEGDYHFYNAEHHGYKINRDKSSSEILH